MAATVARSAAEKDPLKPRVPAAQMERVKKLSTRAPENLVEEGRALSEGKGTCFNCHGKSGKGDGPAGIMLDPGSRDFTNCGVQAKWIDGELFWATQHGVPGTGMGSFTPGIVTEEEVWKILAYIRTFCPRK